MFSVRKDLKNNILMIKYQGGVNVRQAELLVNKLAEELPKFKRGFKVLSDFSELDDMEVECRVFIEKIMDLCAEHGVAMVIRIMPDKTKDIGFNIMSQFHYPPETKIITCKSVEEAKQHFVLSGDSPAMHKLGSFLRIVNMRISEFCSTALFRLIVILAFFALLVGLRIMAHAFAISLRYAYITLIALSGVWFGVRGGVLAAVVSLVIFFGETYFFQASQFRDIVLQYADIALRTLIYLLSGLALGYFSEAEKKLRKQLEVMAGQDALTECYNYRALMRLLETEIMRSKRYKKEMSICILDIDHFKKFNDKYGHLVGNDVLKEFAQVIKANVRAEDFVGRYGGEEFLVIFPESGPKQSEVVVERIRQKLAKTKITSNYASNVEKLSVTFSAGIAAYPANSLYVDELIHAADDALYRAKNSGRDKIVVSAHLHLRPRGVSQEPFKIKNKPKEER